MNECTIEIIRTDRIHGNSVRLGVTLDGADVGSLKNGEEIQITAGPGKHELCFYRYGKVDNTVSFIVSEGQSRALFTVRMNRSNHVEVMNGLKSKQSKKKTHGCLTAILCVIAVFLVIGVIASIASDSSDSGPKKVEDSAASDLSVENQPSAKQDVFTVGEKVELNNVAVTLLSVTESYGSNYISPDSGNVFVICEFEIENNSSNDIAVSSVLSFSAYVDDYATQLSINAMVSSDIPQLDGTISAGKKMHGVVGYETSPDWSEIEIQFTPNLLGREIVFQYKK